MTYGTIKVDTVTFTDAGVDKSVTLSGLVQNPTFSGNVTVTGTLSGVTVTGTTANFTSGNFTNISGGTHTITSGVFAAGSAASPSITFTGDLNTGIYSPGADQVAISTGGTGRLFVDASGNVGVGTASNLLSGANRTTITLNNTSSAAIALGVSGTRYGHFYADATSAELSATSNYLSFTAGSSERLRITSAGLVGVGTSSPVSVTGFGTLLTVANNAGGGIVLQDVNTTLGYRNKYIASVDGEIHFGKCADDGTSPTTQVLLDHTGRLGIGTTSPTSLLHLSASALADLRFTDAGEATDQKNWAWQTGTGIGTGTFRLRAINDANSTGENAYIVTRSGASVQTHQWLTAGSERLRIDSSGRVGIGTTSPQEELHIVAASQPYIQIQSTGGVTGSAYYGYNSSTGSASIESTGSIRFAIPGSEAARIDSSGRLLVGTSSARSNFYNSSSYSPRLQLESANDGASSSIALISVSGGGFDEPNLVFAKSRGSAIGNNTIVVDGDDIGNISFQASDGSEFVVAASILAEVDGTPGANDMPGRLVFSTTADGASSPTERMRIDSAGSLIYGTSTSPGADITSGTGFYYQISTGLLYVRSNGSPVTAFNRGGNDGTLVEFKQDQTTEGTISVSGTTVSYNGAHLSRWSQLPSGAERTEILRGTVLSNIDEMCEWGDEDNDQLNRMKVSDVEGDKNVSGVFQAWDDDDDTYTNDFYCAMTGDFIIRIGAGVTVERGDLLMSAGDGTAKPQDDDIIRSKTIAKVTSINVSCTYDDGSYCVPCVLMAC